MHPTKRKSAIYPKKKLRSRNALATPILRRGKGSAAQEGSSKIARKVGCGTAVRPSFASTGVQHSCAKPPSLKSENSSSRSAPPECKIPAFTLALRPILSLKIPFVGSTAAGEFRTEKARSAAREALRSQLEIPDWRFGRAGACGKIFAQGRAQYSVPASSAARPKFGFGAARSPANRKAERPEFSRAASPAARFLKAQFQVSVPAKLPIFIPAKSGLFSPHPSRIKNLKFPCCFHDSRTSLTAEF